VPTVPPGSIVKSSAIAYWLWKVIAFFGLAAIPANIAYLLSSDEVTRWTETDWLLTLFAWLTAGPTVFITFKRFAIVTCDDSGIDVERNEKSWPSTTPLPAPNEWWCLSSHYFKLLSKCRRGHQVISRAMKARPSPTAFRRFPREARVGRPFMAGFRFLTPAPGRFSVLPRYRLQPLSETLADPRFG